MNIFLSKNLYSYLPDLIFVTVLFISFFIILSLYYRRKKKVGILNSMHTILFELIMPRYAEKEEGEKKEEKKLIEEMEQIYSSCPQYRHP